MEIKKHQQAKKKVEAVTKTFVSASKEVESAIELLDQSIKDDKLRVRKYEDQIVSIYQAIDVVQSNILQKEGERKNHEQLKNNLSQFTGGN